MSFQSDAILLQVQTCLCDSAVSFTGFGSLNCVTVYFLQNQSFLTGNIFYGLSSMDKKGNLSSQKIAEIKTLINTKMYSNREISRRLKISEASVRCIKKKIDLGQKLSPKRKTKCGRKSIFTPRSE